MFLARRYQTTIPCRDCGGIECFPCNGRGSDDETVQNLGVLPSARTWNRGSE
jgi:hypothetical protein